MKASLESMTVKELRVLVKNSVNQRGVLSKLKKKQDLIKFLEEKIKTTTDDLSLPPPKDAHVEEKKNPTRIPLNMPPAVMDVSGEKPRDDSVHISPKDYAFQQVYDRYPSVEDTPYTHYTDPAEDIRQSHHPAFASGNNSYADMEIVTVGTASCTPSVTRGVSCTALKLNWRRRSTIWNPDTGTTEKVDSFQGGTWIFDVGECTQLQIQKTPSVKPSKITKIFLTHAHGDHSFGLPGLLCLMGQDRDRDGPPVEIYGPEGLRKWLRVAIRYSVSRIVPPYRVHEIMDVPMAPEWELDHRRGRYYYRGRSRDGPSSGWGNKGLAGEDPVNWISQAGNVELAPSPFYGEIQGGRDIYPLYDHPLSADGAPVWEIEDEEDVKVYAAPMSHGIPCVGYVVDEQPRPGRLRNELVEPIVRRNVDALRTAGFKIPMKAMAVIKNMEPGSSFTFPDGTVLSQEEAVEPARQGRKVVFCGDTCDSRAMARLAWKADVVVHEATNCFLQGIDSNTNARAVTKDAITHGHSTPLIAGRFARQVQSKRLVLNHFSARYKGDLSVDSLSIMMRIEKIAMKEAELDESMVIASWDLMNLPVAVPED